MSPRPIDSSLHSPVAPAEKKKRPWYVFAFYAVAGVAIVIGVLVGGNLAYLNLNYGLPVFINGTSMYPYLNSDAERLENGSYRPLRFDDGNSIDGDRIDYGYAKGKEKLDIAKDIKRFDVVVSYYPSDYDAQGNLNKRAALKIKRVIGLPGETIHYRIVHVKEGESETANPIWGETTVTSSQYPDGMKLVPTYKTADYHLDGRYYSYPETVYSWAGEESFTITLGPKEYLLAGDNRGYSHDGISGRFAVTEKMIEGKVFLIVGKCKLIADGKQDRIETDYSYLFAPWQYRRLV